MITLVLSLLLGLLLASAFAGPRLIRGGAPALVRTPRLAAGLLSASLVLWVLTSLALGPLLAWLTTGPTVLPSPAGEVCQRCLAAASPFDGRSPIEIAIPGALLLALPALVLSALLTAASRSARARARQARQTCQTLVQAARQVQIDGHDVTVVPEARPVAFALPRRRCGIVLSDGVLDMLEREELAAVLAHEETHLRQRHHLISSVVSAFAHPLRFIPLAAAIADAVPHYLEVAADNTARREVSTPALASALLKLGDASRRESADAPATDALHAAGPDRIRYLVNSHTPAGATRSAVVLALQLASLIALAGAVHGPYLYAALTGCLT